jgi:hypothetical protein
MNTVFRHQFADRNEVDIRRVTVGMSGLQSACRMNSLVRELLAVLCAAICQWSEPIVYKVVVLQLFYYISISTKYLEFDVNVTVHRDKFLRIKTN